MSIQDYLSYLLIYSALAASFFLILTKHRALIYLQTYGKFGINKIASCTLCVCFWLCAFIAVGGWLAGAPIETLTIPIAAASITRAIIN